MNKEDRELRDRIIGNLRTSTETRQGLAAGISYAASQIFPMGVYVEPMAKVLLSSEVPPGTVRVYVAIHGKSRDSFWSRLRSAFRVLVGRLP